MVRCMISSMHAVRTPLDRRPIADLHASHKYSCEASFFHPSATTYLESFTGVCNPFKGCIQLPPSFFRDQDELRSIFLVPRLRWICGAPGEPQPRKPGRLMRHPSARRALGSEVRAVCGWARDKRSMGV